MTDSFMLRIAQVIKRIPAGRVASYGQIAALAGNPQGARQVVWTLNALWEKEKLPWHRVINAQGRISLPGKGGELQRTLLEQEGVGFDERGRIDLKRFGWNPRDTEDS
jgi:methylated-DNA-protein-cysteine methyltransferase-like protein